MNRLNKQSMLFGTLLSIGIGDEELFKKCLSYFYIPFLFSTFILFLKFKIRVRLKVKYITF